MTQLHKIFAILTIGGACAMPAFAADTTGCSDDNNMMINPVVALCSTHAYNITTTSNVGQNYANDSDRQNQRDVIALKTTIVTQQMKQQYDYLNSTIKRLKTQLQKAVLTTSLEAAGASSDSGSSSYSNDRNISLAGAQNCNNQNTTADVFTCLRNNYNLIYNMSNGGRSPTSELRQQLITDCNTANNNSSAYEVKAIDTKCTNRSTLNTAQVFAECLDALNANIRTTTEKIQQQNSQVNALQSLFGK